MAMSSLFWSPAARREPARHTPMLSWLCYINLGLAAFKQDPGLPHDRVHNEVEAVEGIIHLVRSARGFRTRRFISTAHGFFTSRAVCAPAPAVRSPRPRSEEHTSELQSRQYI